MLKTFCSSLGVHTINAIFFRDQEYYCTTCKACGLKASMKCSACKKVSYCCKEHQVLDWKQHKSVCKGLCNSSHNISLHSVTQFKGSFTLSLIVLGIVNFRL